MLVPEFDPALSEFNVFIRFLLTALRSRQFIALAGRNSKANFQRSGYERHSARG
jgi:hypothetical protein